MFLRKKLRNRNASMETESSGGGLLSPTVPSIHRALSSPPATSRQDEAIAQQLEEWKSMDSKVIKVALLGMDGAGKLTLLQHFKLLNNKPTSINNSVEPSANLAVPNNESNSNHSSTIDIFELDDEKYIVPLIHKRIIDLFKTTVVNNTLLDVEACTLVNKFEGDTMTTEFQQAVMSIWKDSVFQSALLFHKWADYFEYVSANYWGGRLAEIFKPDYFPSEEDILTVMVEMRREALSAFIDTEVIVDDAIKIQISCPYRNKWKKLIPVFLPSVHALVMMLDSSNFGYVESATDPSATKNRSPLIETKNQLKTFAEHLNRLNAKCCIFLVMNKIDLLEKNLKMDNIGSFHPEFATLDEDVDKFANWIQKTYSEALSSVDFDTKYFHVLRLNAKDPESLKQITETIQKKVQQMMKSRKL